MSRNKGGMLSVGFFTLLGLVSLGADGDAALTRTKVGEIMKLSPSGRKTPYPVQPTGERGKARDEKETDLLSSNPQDIPTGGSGESTCPEGWDKIHRGCYKFVTGGKTWNEALEFCKNSAGELTSVQSMREKEELQSHLLSNYPSFAKWWVGFQREGTRGTNWKWISNNNVDPSVTPWNNQRIKGRPGNMCGMIDMGRKKLEISVTSCAKNQSLICEFHQITARPTEVTRNSVHHPKADLPTAPTPTVDQAKPNISQMSEGCFCNKEQEGRSDHQEDPLKRNIGQNVDSQLYERYLQSEINANNAKIAYYREVSELYENALRAQTDYYNSYQAKIDMEVEQMRNGPKCT